MSAFRKASRGPFIAAAMLTLCVLLAEHPLPARGDALRDALRIEAMKNDLSECLKEIGWEDPKYKSTDPVSHCYEFVAKKWGVKLR
jgi:hypothetical protein